jgi:hypothetical protein
MSLTGIRASFAINELSNELSAVIAWARCKHLVEGVVNISI